MIHVPRGEVILRVDGEVSVLKVFAKSPPTTDMFPPLITDGHPFYMIDRDFV